MFHCKFFKEAAKTMVGLAFVKASNKLSMSKKIFIVSGGTGGHIIPARCLATHLAKENCEVMFFGDTKLTNYTKKEDRFPSIIISSSQIKKSPFFLLKAITRISFGILQSFYFCLRFYPQYVVSFGGYATFPMLIAAILTKRKIILHEQNSHLGKVNRIFANFTKKIAISFPETSGISQKNLSKIALTGNPVREEIFALNKLAYTLPKPEEMVIMPDNKMGYDVILASDFYESEKERLKDFFKILIIGGSGGAKIFSEILPKAFFNLGGKYKDDIQIIQQCRSELMEKTFEQYQAFNLNIVIDSFFENMDELIRDSHLIIARAGSSSIFEFCAAKKPMILIPFAAAADNHQEKNARYLEKHGAAIVIKEEDFTINKISEVLKQLIDNPENLQKMSEKSGSLAMLNATKDLKRLCDY
ncbi:MAG: undecaprenyldiphospho-muramoylpentapeptide beta-N-acetylglucosaminyltransferase [Alphaproteobacteria bacterium RIFCSPLOWO2_02_FULL_40_19]|nr:MAG: undecaprenyldiphospho-muramoylpentapeptide beta-N-acetylglucosaminyltransferase [Alphaproteobacteria bacterium RIFCSPLOWO2_02_FULL_40_19]